jgi:hypothetical protein
MKPPVPVPVSVRRLIRSVPGHRRAARLVPARIWHGRPGRLTARITGGFVLAEITFHSGAGPAAITGTLAGIVTWLALAARADIAPPPGR